jgi:DNA-binding transcriptional ArsR family regulator
MDEEPETGPFDPASTIRLRDPKAMRALAHPLRMELLGQLRTRGPQTVGMLSDLLDEAPGSISYHVGKLAEFGFAEEAPELARDRREHWWRAAHAHTSWSMLEALDDPERHAATTLLQRSIIQRYAEAAQEYIGAVPSMDREWVHGATSTDVFLHLTSAEMNELKLELNALAARWESRSSDADRKGTETISLIYLLFRRP